MSKKVIVWLLVAVVFSMVAVGCGKQEAPKQEAKAAKQFKLKFSTPSVPTDAHTEALTKFKEAIEKSTNGQIQIEIYHSASLFTQDAELPAVMRGNLDMFYSSAFWLADKAPVMSMFTAGYIFKDYNHMNKVYQGEIGKEVFDKVAKDLGVRPLVPFYTGSRTLNLRDVGREVKTPADLKGIKLRMPNTPAYMFLGKALGGNATPLNFNEIYLALKTGTIDAQDNPMPTNKNAKFYEVTKYLVLTNHIIDPLCPTINEKVWQEMGPELQKKMIDALNVAKDFCDKKNLQAEAELVAFFKQQGQIVIEPDINAFRSAVQKAYLDNKEISGKWDMALYKKVEDLAK